MFRIENQKVVRAGRRVSDASRSIRPGAPSTIAAYIPTWKTTGLRTLGSVRCGTVIGRRGRVYVSQVDDDV